MDTLNTQMSAADKLAVDQAVDYFNKQNTVNGRQTSNQLGKDDFLKLLITQMQNQDLNQWKILSLLLKWPSSVLWNK